MEVEGTGSARPKRKDPTTSLLIYLKIERNVIRVSAPTLREVLLMIEDFHAGESALGGEDGRSGMHLG